MSTTKTVYTDLIAGACAGCFSTIIGHPLDCLKVHMQTRPQKSFASLQTTRAVATHLLSTEGPSVFVRGMTPPLINAILMNTLMFGVFDECKRRISGDDNPTMWSSLIAGAVSGIATACLSTPVDWIKVQFQLSNNINTTTGSKSFVRNVLLSNPRALYTGHIMNICREGVFTCIYLGFYDTLRRPIMMHYSSSSSTSPPLYLVAMSASLTGAIAWVASYPFDCIKSVQQSQPPARNSGGIRSAVEYIRRQGGGDGGGWRGFYRGCLASTGRAILVTCSRLVVFEAIRAALSKG